MKTLVLCDSSDFVSYQRFENSILNALDFYQIWHQSIDISYTLIDSIELDETCLLIIAQEGIARKLGPSDWRLIFKKVAAGMGLVIFDGALNTYQQAISPYTGIPSFNIEKTGSFSLEDTWISELAAEKTIHTNIPVLTNYPLEIDETWHVFLRNHKGNPVGIWKKFGKGKACIIGISQGIWHKNCLGHTCGFDSVFWRCLVLTAKKPFVFKAVPPFVTCRINDAIGSGSFEQSLVNQFRYISILNESGFVPHVGLCINQVQQESVPYIRELYYQAKAEFSAHAFTSHHYEKDPSIYMGSDGREFSFEQLKAHFEQIDNFFNHLNIKPAKTINAHRSQIGYNAIGFFKQRQQTFSASFLKPGKIFSDPRALSWEPKPFGIINFCVDYLDENQDIFNAVSNPGRISEKGADIDFLDRATSNLSAIENGIFQIKRGLENLSFGCLMFHEKNCENFAVSDFEMTVGMIATEIKKIPNIPKPYDYIAAYLKNRLDSKIVSMKHKNSHLFITLSGKSILPQFLYCFLENGPHIVQNFLEIPTFEKSIELTYKLVI
ncbi:MAG TPA: hypothetical protein PK303_07970 [bacterium]|nr:hypothetical protein [bacterium]HOL35694.1 hypothetical protein [bacterium]HPP09038.1 hypothetical protein [bacterium]